MSEKRTYRASEAPLAMLCAGSVNAPADEILIDSVNPAGTVGTVVHKCCEQLVNTGIWDHGGMCQMYGLDAAQTKEVGSLVYAAKAFWDANKGAFFEPRTEVELKALYISGHLDVLSWLADKIACVLDWKTTRLDIDYTPQMLFYAWLVQLNFPIEAVKTVTVFLRDRTANIKIWESSQIADFANQFLQDVADWDGRTYRPGGHCAYCKRFASCPAHREMVSQTVAELIAYEDHQEIWNKPAAFVDFYKRIQAVEVLAKKAREHVRAAVEQAGSELPGLKLVPSSRDTIDAKKAWPVLETFMAPDDFSDAVEIKKGPLMEAIAKTAPRGKKKDAKDLLMIALKEVGAVTTTEFKTLRVVQNNESEVKLVGTSETE